MCVCIKCYLIDWWICSADSREVTAGYEVVTLAPAYPDIIRRFWKMPLSTDPTSNVKYLHYFIAFTFKLLIVSFNIDLPTYVVAFRNKLTFNSPVYDQLYRCLPCSAGCDVCVDDSPCLAPYDWPFRFESSWHYWHLMKKKKITSIDGVRSKLMLTCLFNETRWKETYWRMNKEVRIIKHSITRLIYDMEFHQKHAFDFH